jgi:hypothetical protein
MSRKILAYLSMVRLTKNETIKSSIEEDIYVEVYDQYEG